MSSVVIFIIFAVLVLCFVLIIIRGRADERRHTEEIVKNSWGTHVSQLYSAEKLKSVKQLSSRPGEVRGSTDEFCMDDITRDDLDMDALFTGINRTVSAPGEEVLYYWLTHPLISKEAVEKRKTLIEYYLHEERAREETLRILYTSCRPGKNSLCDSILSLKDGEPIGKKAYAALSLMTLFSFILLAVKPLPAVIILIPVLFLDFRVHLTMKDRTGRCLSGFAAILSLLDCADRLVRLAPDLPDERLEKIAERASSFSGFRSGSFLVTGGGSAGNGIGDAILEYIKMFFHIDLIRFDGMLKTVKAHTDEAISLLFLIGELDAAISAASLRASSDHVCIPEFVCGGSCFPVVYEELVHPLLEHAVPNSLCAESSILLTGANASGKSTFLKSAACAAVMAQSIVLAAAKAYRAPLFRIYTSIALSDNLSRGESYYVAEIRSMKRILDAAKGSDPPVLAVIDEILRGTNTTERIAASSQLLKYLAGCNAFILAATHDRELTEMSGELYRNMHFEENVKDGSVCFDYILREGPSRGRNAIRLLAESGFDDEIVENAVCAAEKFERTGEWNL